MGRRTYDVLIIGAGALGIAVARELSKYNIDVLVVDRNNDVGGDASKSNSAIVHTGFDAPPGSLESEMVVHSNPMFDEVCSDLDIPFSRCGALLAAITTEEENELPAIMEKANRNHVFDVEYLNAREVLDLEPEINPEVKAGLWIPRESIIDPFILVVAQAENAVHNGVEFLRLCEVCNLTARNGSFHAECIYSDKTLTIESRFVVNAAGLGTEKISRMLGIDDFAVHPRRGQFFVIDRAAPFQINHIILPVPTKISKGKLFTPTVHGNWLAGPTAEDITIDEGATTTREGLEEIVRGVRKLVPGFDSSYAITQYAGLRPVRTPGGYYVRGFESNPGYLELSGIRSTGISSSLAVARRAVRLLGEMGMETARKRCFTRTRKGIALYKDMSENERSSMAEKNPAYSRIVCRCETVSEAEVIESIRRSPGARDIDGIKRRTRAGLGRCQAGFCGSRVPMILAEELGIPIDKVTKKGPGSALVAGPKNPSAKVVGNGGADR